MAYKPNCERDSNLISKDSKFAAKQIQTSHSSFRYSFTASNQIVQMLRLLGLLTASQRRH